MLTLLAYILIGAVAGLTAGVFGLGGGIIIVPTLIFSFGFLGVTSDSLTHIAVGTSLSTIMFTSLSAIRVHHLQMAINWPLAINLSIGMIAGGLLGASFAQFFSGELLQRAFALYCVIVAFQMWFSWSPKASLSLPNKKGCTLLGTVIGSISGLFGIAGGSLVVPVLMLYRIKITEAIATSSVTGFPLALSGTIGYILTGWGESQLPQYSLGYIYLPATFGIIISSTFFAKVGAKLVHRLEPVYLKKSFSIVLLLIACKLFF